MVTPLAREPEGLVLPSALHSSFLLLWSQEDSWWCSKYWNSCHHVILLNLCVILKREIMTSFVGSPLWIQDTLACARDHEGTAHCSPGKPEGDLAKWDPAVTWWLTDSLGPDIHILHLLLSLPGRLPPCSGEMREPVRGSLPSDQACRLLSSEALYLKLIFKLIVGYGGWKNQPGYCF